MSMESKAHKLLPFQACISVLRSIISHLVEKQNVHLKFNGRHGMYFSCGNWFYHKGI